MGIYLIISGLIFFYLNLYQLNPDMTSYLSIIPIIFLVAVPVLTMRLISDEKRQKTDQLLLTSPVTVTEVVLGKFLAAISFFGLTLLITLSYPLILGIYGEIESLHILVNYIIFFMLGSSFIAIGLFMSSITENQVIAAVSTSGVLLVFWLMYLLRSYAPTTRISSIIFIAMIATGLALLIYSSTRNIFISVGAFLICGLVTAFVFVVDPYVFDGLISKTLKFINVLERNSDTMSGMLTLEPIIFYASFSWLFVFLTVQNIEKRRWS